MITQLTHSIEMDYDPVGYIMKNYEDVSTTTPVAVYIPRVMSGIEREDEPKTSIKEVKNTSWLFRNAKDCAPPTTNTIVVRNYLEAYPNDNTKSLKKGDKVVFNFYNNSIHEIHFLVFGGK